MKPAGSRADYRWWAAGIAAAVALAWLTWWLVVRGTRGAEIAGDLAVPAGLVVAVAAIWPLLPWGRPDRSREQKNPLRHTRAAMDSPQDRARSVALWGPVASGKTTFLPALNIALGQASPPWTLTGANPASLLTLVRLTSDLAGERMFPAPTSTLEHYEFVLSGNLEAQGQQYRSPKLVPVKVSLSVVDVPGEAYRSGIREETRLGEDLVAELERCDGIVFFFDPTLETVSTAYSSFQVTAARLEHMMGSGARLPHRVAICIAKYDEPSVFSTALEAGYLVTDRKDPYGFPRVADDKAADFLDLLDRKLHPDGAPLFRHTIERYFDKRRIRYFVISSAGFYLNDSMRFDPDDYYNLVRGDLNRLRGRIYPMNLLQPLVWLVAPDDYDAAAVRHVGLVSFDPEARSGSGTRQDRNPSAAAAPGPSSGAMPAHLICMAETGLDHHIRLSRDRPRLS